MKKVCVYPFGKFCHFTLSLPVKAKILGIQVQENRAQILALVNPYESVENRRFYMARTDEKIPEDMGEGMAYVGTFELALIEDGDGDHTKHLFEVLK